MQKRVFTKKIKEILIKNIILLSTIHSEYLHLLYD